MPCHQKKIGIIVPSLNRYRKTKRFINALSLQTYKNFHLYLVDSGSTDGTKLLSQTNLVPCTFIQATLDDWWAACTNLGVKHAIKDGCELLLTINDDSIIMADYLEKLVNIFEKNKIRVLANQINFADSPAKVWALGSYSIWGSPFLFQLRYNSIWEDELLLKMMGKEIIPSMAACGDGVLIDKSVFDEIGFYNEKFTPQVHSDSEFTMRCNKLGIHVYVTPKVILYNDTDNMSEDESNKKNKKFSFIKKLKLDFFDKKSNLYWKPTLYITLKYAPRKYKFRTLLCFFVYNFSIICLSVLKDIRSGPLPLFKKNKYSKFLQILKPIVKSTLKFSERGIKSWLFNSKKYYHCNHLNLGEISEHEKYIKYKLDLLRR